LLISLGGSALWLLTTPIHADQQLPGMTRMIAHLEMLSDHFGYPLQCPEVGGVACRQGAFEKDPLKFGFLCL
jgi:hypothetical protein